jgi:hypothetical protein
MANFTFIRASSYRYTLRQFKAPFSFELIRNADNASAYFQGDDAYLWDRNILALDKIENSARGWCAGNSFTQSFDFLCSGYDDVLKQEKSA